MYTLWTEIKKRCYNKNSKTYPHYGGRGITMFAGWKNDYVAFKAYVDEELGPQPSDGHSLDRIDNEGNYAPGNIRWATREEQNRNTRRNVFLTFNGKTQCIAAWDSELGNPPGTLRRRVKDLNWSVERALTTPVRESN
jgi:hypothetical protein